MVNKHKASECLFFILNIILVIISGNCYVFLKNRLWLIPLLIIITVLCNLMPGYCRNRYIKGRLRMCLHGCKCLLIFLISMFLSAAFQIYYAVKCFPDSWTDWVIGIIICILILGTMFWNGIICVYLTSVQLGIRRRVVGLIFCFIPIINFIILLKIVSVTYREVRIESEHNEGNDIRSKDKVCSTRYPVLFVHGVFFRDYKYLNYWGRIPHDLEINGARVFYGEHQSAASVKESAYELADRINNIVSQTGCGKLNIIAHSKGGLDVRYAVANCGIKQYIASITTINTPHRGCIYADYLLGKVPEKIKNNIASTYNTALKKFGDENPDFLAAVYDLTSTNCIKLDSSLSKPEGVFCQSFGSRLNHATGGKFPLNFSYELVKHFDGPNDGLVGESSFKWGDEYKFLTVKGRRGISHGDMIDLNRENIIDFDIREFYVSLVSNLKKRNL